MSSIILDVLSWLVTFYIIGVTLPPLVAVGTILVFFYFNRTEVDYE